MVRFRAVAAVPASRALPTDNQKRYPAEVLAFTLLSSVSLPISMCLHVFMCRKCPQSALFSLHLLMLQWRAFT